MGGRNLRSAVAAAFVLAGSLLAGCADAEGGAGPADSTDESQSASEDAVAALEATAPDGKYAAAYVLESTNIPGFKPGFKSSGTYAFTFEKCTDTECSGTVKAPGEGTYTWDGTELTMTFDEIDKTEKCVDDGGKEIKSDTYRTHTEHGARLTPAEEGDAKPTTFEGTYQQETALSDFTNGCTRDGPSHQRAEFSLVLERK